jgi:hypothetical protein
MDRLKDHKLVSKKGRDLKLTADGKKEAERAASQSKGSPNAP